MKHQIFNSNHLFNCVERLLNTITTKCVLLLLITTISSAYNLNADPFGTNLGSFNGVTVYSNGSTATVSRSDSGWGTKWQCVEFARRYLDKKYGKVLPRLGANGGAKLLVTKSLNGNFSRYVANTSYTFPSSVSIQVGDAVVTTKGTYGHVAIVREVGPTYIKVAQQNFKNDYRDINYTVNKSTFSDGSFKLTFSGSTHIVKAIIRATNAVVPPNTPRPQSPVASNTTIPVQFAWSAISRGVYRIQISTSKSGWSAKNGFTANSSCNSKVVVNKNTGNHNKFSWSSLSSGVCANPLRNTTYYWTVRVYVEGKGVSSYSSPKAFKTSNNTGGGSSKPDIYLSSQRVNDLTVSPNQTIRADVQQNVSSNVSGTIRPYVGYYYSRNTTLSSDDILLANDISSLSRSTRSNSENATFKIPSSAATGTGYILFVADYRKNIAESNEANNVRYVKINVSGGSSSGGSSKPDIYLSGASVDDKTVRPGQRIRASVTQRVSGNISGTIKPNVLYVFSYDSKLSSDDKALSEDESTLNNGRRLEGEYDYITIPGNARNGTAYILMYADARKEVSESNEGNNLIAVRISVNGYSGRSSGEGGRITAFPNPTRGSTTLSFQVDQPGEAVLRVMNATGQVVKELQKNYEYTGHYKEQVDLQGLDAGMYYLQWMQGRKVQTIPVQVLRN